MNKENTLEFIDLTGAMFAILPDRIVLDIVRDTLPKLIELDELNDDEIITLIKLYRNRDAPALKMFIKCMCKDTKRLIEKDTF